MVPTRTEHRVVVAALALIALHIADDNYLQPEPGTSAGDHLASGLVPIAILIAVGFVYPHLHRAGMRATLLMTLGAIGIAIGVPGVYYLTDGTASGDHYTAPFAIVAGVVLFVLGPVVLWTARRTGGSRRRRYARRGLEGAAAVPLAFVVFSLIVLPIGFSYIYSHTGRTAKALDLGVPYEKVKVRTTDGLNLAAAYVPSKNRAALILYPGREKEARPLIRHGYGVLLLEPRGQADSQGDIVRWAGDRDLHAGVKFLQARSDVDPARIGAVGYSIGGEILLEAAGQSDAIKAVVSEGAGERVGSSESLSGTNKLIYAPSAVAISLATTVFSNHGPPPPIPERIGRIAPRPVFLIYADPGQGGEKQLQQRFYRAAGQPKSIWKVPGAKHTGGIRAQPEEYDRRVTGFFDRALLGE
jgi:hypothetical protein